MKKIILLCILALSACTSSTSDKASGKPGGDLAAINAQEFGCDAVSAINQVLGSIEGVMPADGEMLDLTQPYDQPLYPGLNVSYGGESNFFNSVAYQQYYDVTTKKTSLEPWPYWKGTPPSSTPQYYWGCGQTLATKDLTLDSWKWYILDDVGNTCCNDPGAGFLTTLPNGTHCTVPSKYQSTPAPTRFIKIQGMNSIADVAVTKFTNADSCLDFEWIGTFSKQLIITSQVVIYDPLPSSGNADPTTGNYITVAPTAAQGYMTAVIPAGKMAITASSNYNAAAPNIKFNSFTPTITEAFIYLCQEADLVGGNCPSFKGQKKETPTTPSWVVLANQSRAVQFPTSTNANTDSAKAAFNTVSETLLGNAMSLLLTGYTCDIRKSVNPCIFVVGRER